MFEHRNPWVKQEFQSATDVASRSAADAESDNMDIDNIKGLSSSADSSYVGLVCEVWDSTKSTKRGNVIISSVVDSNTVKFKVMGDAAIDVADNDFFIVVGNAHGEGSSAPDAWSDELGVVWIVTGKQQKK